MPQVKTQFVEAPLSELLENAKPLSDNLSEPPFKIYVPTEMWY